MLVERHRRQPNSTPHPTPLCFYNFKTPNGVRFQGCISTSKTGSRAPVCGSREGGRSSRAAFLPAFVVPGHQCVVPGNEGEVPGLHFYQQNRFQGTSVWLQGERVRFQGINVWLQGKRVRFQGCTFASKFPGHQCCGLFSPDMLPVLQRVAGFRLSVL